YAQYRSSAVGGGYKVITADINQLIDQFGWGIKNNPLSIKNFLRFARTNFPDKEQYCLIIGKAVSPQSIRNRVNSNNNVSTNIEARPDITFLNLVPTYGGPFSSDVLLASDEGSVVPKTHIGRLNVVRAREVKDYLDKIKLYDSWQNNRSCSIDDEIWKKDIIHVGGANDFLGEQIMYYLDRYKETAEDTLLGAEVYTLQKSSLSNVQVIAGERITNYFNNGFSLLTYFGHSSASTLEFNLDNPENYQYSGKFPVFLVNGCSAGNMFILDSIRLRDNYGISEKYVIATPLRGGIAFVASTGLGIVNYLHLYSEEFYNQLTKVSYGQTLGKILSNVVDTLISRYTFNDFFVRIHTEQITLHGDPAVIMYHYEKPDYAIDNKSILVNPEFVSIEEKSYSLKIKVHNIGRTTRDSLLIRIKKILPNGKIDTIIDRKFNYLLNSDSVIIDFPLNLQIKDENKGSNKFIVTLDPDNEIEEMCESNNEVTKEFFVYEDEIKPVYPYNYTIINKSNVKFYASTSNTAEKTREYFFQIDTTQGYNSSLFLEQKITQIGGLITFAPAGLNLKNNTVYYWRVGFKNDNSGEIKWNQHSFIYRENNPPGFNQSHYYQFKNNTYSSLELDPISRAFSFGKTNRVLKIKTGLFPYYDFTKNNVYLDLEFVEFWRCDNNVFSIYVFEPKSLIPWENGREQNSGKYASIAPCEPVKRTFEYYMNNSVSRDNARKFLENEVPDSAIVLIINQGAGKGSFVAPNTSFIQQWMNDTITYGSGNSIYHTFIKNGLTQIDSFTRNIPFAFLYRKGDPQFVRQFVGEFESDYIDVAVDVPAQFINGQLESPWMGPMKSWDKFFWDGDYKDGKTDKDTTYFQLVGRRADGSEQVFTDLFESKETPITFIDANEFPYLKMKMVTEDSVKLTPFQLDYWRLTGEYLPEGALAPNIKFVFNDTLEAGMDFEFAIAFKNISESAFDSLKLKLVITNANNKDTIIPMPKTKPLVSGDTILVTYKIPSDNFIGLNKILLFVNPDNDQPEQTLFNNIISKTFFVKTDDTKGWLDVTFDGVHILNKDIVSSRPQIAIKIKDESRFVPILKQDSIIIRITFPDKSVRNYVIGSDSVRITNSDLSTGINELLIQLIPTLDLDGEYELSIEPDQNLKQIFTKYTIGFTVYNKPMISNLFNYPNPFTSSTAFVFTLTGSEIPQNLRIQIMTISGKVVREITKNELGTLRIGRNITDYKWDGTDQFGNKLANGVYLYRVITNLNGKKLDKYSDPNNNTDKFFTNGYGKMYLMR
ncbi:MAG: C25 family cysteine peptidase, partial [Bacteroidota bacterium]